MTISYRLQMRGYEWKKPATRPSEVTRSLRLLRNELKTEFRNELHKMTAKRNKQLAARTTFLDVAYELFCDGISWIKIVKLFAFVREMTFTSYNINKAELVDDIAELLSSYIEIKLLMWIHNNEDCNGLVTFFENRCYN
ncbi:apoptosis regulator Bcl-2-like [Centruroides sculpturatus]|uniref:apoptosis regulator Bcl-2-like n=1 Tax=Centruroides sculpturatus TaxID=218467 RepID=UPI000C6D8D60|nr:apoptosis regulator Bcl-2-like [Centruroides sculpturatus]